jgi:PHD/YefM family antitoxin component YafN of YafNO toxin-antitoxin module
MHRRGCPAVTVKLEDNLNHFGAQRNKERILLTRHGKPVAALVPAEDWERLIVLVVHSGHHRDVYR